LTLSFLYLSSLSRPLRRLSIPGSQKSYHQGRHPQEKKKVGGLGHNQNSI
jgi:hypothetical protein